MTLTARGVLEVRLFGVPQVTLAGQVVSVPTKRAWGVVAFLALEGATSRDKLAELLWDEAFTENPRRNLRQELYRLAKTPLADFLEVDDLVSLRCCCDAQVARDSEVLITADFMSRFDVPQAPSFQSWLQMQRETFSRLRLSRLEARAKSLVGLPALDAWLEVLRADALRENAVQAALQLEAQYLGKAAAFERYIGFKALLKSELGLEPLPETLALARELDLEKANVPKAKSDTRIDRLLEAAGLLHQPFEAPMLLDVLGLTDFEVLEALETATSKGLLKRTESHYELLKPVSGLTAERKRIFERRIAKRLLALGSAPEMIAAHLEQAGEYAEAVQKYIEAAELAKRQNHVSEAMQFYNKAIELSPDPEQRFKVLKERIHLAKRLDNRIWREAIRDMEREARNLSLEHRIAADLERALWHFNNAEYDKTLEFASPHLERNGKFGAIAAYLQGIVYVKTGRLAEAQTFLDQALAGKSLLTDHHTAELHNVLSMMDLQRGQLQTAKVHNQIALKGFARSGYEIGLSRALSAAGVIEMLSGQYRASERMFKRSLELAERLSDHTGQIATLLNLSKASFETSRFENSHAYLEQGLALLEQHPNEDLRGSYLVNIAAIERIQMKLDMAWMRVVKAVELAQSQNVMPKVASRALILVSMAIERHQYKLASRYIELATQHLTPELDSELTLQKAHLVLHLRPQEALDLLTKQTFQNDDLEYAIALMAFAYLKLHQPEKAKAILEINATSIFAPFVQAARIETHASLGSLETSHFEPLPSKNAYPFIRYKLNLAFANHAPDKQKYSRAFRQLETQLAATI